MEKRTANDVITLARVQDRLTTLEYIEAIFEDFLEFHGDRYFANDLAVVDDVATSQGKPVTVVGIQKGRNLPENIERNFDSPNPEGYREALRLMKQAEKFNRPVIAFVNVAGAYYGIGAEERGGGETITQSLLKMSNLEMPIISIITGKGGSGGALALAVADKVWTLEHTIYVVLSSKGFASILWKDGSRAKEVAKLIKIIATGLKKLAIVDKVIPEVMDGQPLGRAKTNRVSQKAFISKLTELIRLDTETLLEKKYQRFRRCQRLLLINELLKG